MLKLCCLCNSIQIEIVGRPDYINACNCSLCRKSGAWWAYLPSEEVDISGPTSRYCRQDKAEPNAEIHFCRRCGSTTHFTLTASAASNFGDSVIGVNMRLATESELEGIELQFPDGQAWSGIGEFGFVREPHVLGSEPCCDGGSPEVPDVTLGNQT